MNILKKNVSMMYETDKKLNKLNKEIRIIKVLSYTFTVSFLMAILGSLYIIYKGGIDNE